MQWNGRVYANYLADGDAVRRILELRGIVVGVLDAYRDRDSQCLEQKEREMGGGRNYVIAGNKKK